MKFCLYTYVRLNDIARNKGTTIGEGRNGTVEDSSDTTKKEVPCLHNVRDRNSFSLK